MEGLRETVDECEQCHSALLKSVEWSTAELKREAAWEQQLQKDFLDCEAKILQHLELRKADPTSVSQSSRNSSRMASVRRTEVVRAEKVLIIFAEAEERELDRQGQI